MLLKFLINGLITGLLYSLLAIGFSLVYNTTHIFHIAAAGIYVFAAYMFWWLATMFGVPIFFAAVLAIVLTMGLSLLSELCVYRPLRKKKASLNIIMIASFGLMMVIVNLIAMLFGNETRVVETSVLRTYLLGNVTITTPQLYQAIVSSIAIVLFVALLRFTKFGLKIRAISDNENLFEALGYSKQHFFTLTFLSSGLFIGLASCATVYETGSYPNMGMTVLINAMVAMIIGGTGRFVTCVAGGLVLGVLQSLAVLCFATNWQNAVTFVLLLGFLFFRPQGIAGHKKRTV